MNLCLKTFHMLIFQTFETLCLKLFKFQQMNRYFVSEYTINTQTFSHVNINIDYRT